MIGFRWWKADFNERGQLALQSTGMYTKWTATKFKAECTAYGSQGHQHHSSPNEACTCGIHAFKRLKTADQRHGGDILGAVLTWGKHIEHGDEGYRAEQAQIIAFVEPSLEKGVRQFIVQKALTEEAGKQWNIPVIPFPDFERYCKEFGDFLE